MPGNIGDLQTKESFACQRLGGEGGCPGTIDPKSVRIPSVGLYDQRIFLAGNIVQGPIQPALDFMVGRGFPGNFLDTATSEAPQLAGQLTEYRSPAGSRIHGE